MSIKALIVKEFVRNGYTKRGKNRIWYVTNPNLLFATPELARAFFDFTNFWIYRKGVIGRELSLFKKNSDMLRKIVGKEPFNLIDLNCLRGERAKEFLNILHGIPLKIRYCPVGMHPSMGKVAIKQIRSVHFKNIVGYKLETSRFENLVQLPTRFRNSTFQRNVILLLGSVLASFQLNDFLFQMSNHMLKGDILIAGNGIRKGPRLVNLETYQHSIFNEWGIHLMEELGFSKYDLTYNARFGNKRIECFYKLLTDKTIKYNGKKFVFRRGDEIIIAVIYKYYERELRKFFKMYFSYVNVLKDEDNEYVLIVCKK